MSKAEERNDKEPDKEESIPTASMGGSAVGPGGQIGPYKLLSILGEGGFGVVYLAERQRPVKRRVALKVIKPGMDTKQVIARFEAERQALAMLEHPNIAHVFNAGTTDAGRPYFVMEYVKGVPITEHCDRHKLTIEERLKLFLLICEAVQHAHQKGIIHRDIKPSNIQVSIEGEKAVPKVIDFGVVKAISQPLTERTLVTEQGQFVGTPEYMSPEQAEMTGQDVDTRTDIYSLGVVLYELLTGVLPFDPATLREGGVDHIRQVIREEEPKTPSTRLSTLGGEESTRLAQHRRIDPGTLQRRLRGDLDWITLKAMEKDRTRRYQTAHALDEDIQRHLTHEPVLAGPPSTIYRLKKFLRKYRTQAIAAATMAILVACIAVVFVMYLGAVSRGKEAEFLEHKDILSKAMEFQSKGQFEGALTKVETVVNSEHVGADARLLRARLVLKLYESDPNYVGKQGPADAVGELERLVNERDEIACQAHFLLARIYLESDPGDPETTEEYQQKAKEHQQKGEALFSETAEAYFNRAMIAGTVKKTLEYLNKAVDLDRSHYDSLKSRALAYYALRDYRNMERDAVAMTTLRAWDSLGYSLMAIALRETEYFADAVKYHNKAIKLSPDEAELYDKRRRTHMRMGNYEQALSDAQECVRLQPDVKIYHFHAFCALVASGRYDEAKVKYETIIKSGLMTKRELDLSAAKYVSDTLDAGLSWYPPQRRPEGAAFLAMHEAAEIYHQLAKKAKRVVSEGFHANWSPDGTELAYSSGILGFSGIEVVNLENGKTRLLTVPGLDPAWSPDGHHIAFVRVRQPLLLTDFTTERPVKSPPHSQREVWLIKSDGTEEPRFLARGSWPSWASDSKRVFYHWQEDMKLYSISIEDSPESTPLIWCPSTFPAVSPDEKYVAYRDVDGSLKIVDISTKSVVASWTVPLAGGEVFPSWSPNGEEVSVGDSSDRGLWVYDVKKKKASKVLSGSFGWCSWSRPDISQIAIGRIYRGLYREIWVAKLDPNVSTTEALGPGRTIQEHCQEMVDFYTRRIDTEPEDAENYLSRARNYIYLENKEKAFADLQKYADIVKDPSKAAAEYGNLGWSLISRPQEMVNPEIAVALYRKANEIEPESWMYLSCLGWAHYLAGQWEEAITALTKSTELSSEDNLALLGLCLSMAHWQSGNKAAAADWYNKAIELVQKNDIDIVDSRWSLLYSIHLEAGKLMGIKTKGFDRKAPLTGKRILAVTAQADSSHLDMTVAHILDGTGLADGDGDGLLEHDENPENMWLNGEGQASGWVEFDLGGVYELGSILVWNYNERGHTKRGIKRADISVWTQDRGWRKVLDDFEFAEAEGSFDYDEPTLVKFDGVKAQRVRFDDLVNLGDEEYVGLSEVRFFQGRGPEAITPHPADGANIGVPMEARLSWTPAVGAKAYKIYLGTNPDSLKYMGKVEAGDTSEVKLPRLQKCQRYWWRVDAEKSDGSMIKGKLWSFSTGRMVAWWKFEEAKGGVTVDSSDSGLDGKLMGDAKIVEDAKRGSVLSLDGDGDYVDCGKDSAFDITKSITVTAWVNITTVPTIWTGIVTKGESAWRLSTYRDQRRFHFAITAWAAGANWVNGDIEVDTGEWHHVCGTYDGADIRLYVDGIEDPNSPMANSGSISSNGEPVYIGGNSEETGRFWNGLIDDVRIYSYALSEDEIKALYAGKEPGPTSN